MAGAESKVCQTKQKVRVYESGNCDSSYGSCGDSDGACDEQFDIIPPSARPKDSARGLLSEALKATPAQAGPFYETAEHSRRPIPNPSSDVQVTPKATSVLAPQALKPHGMVQSPPIQSKGRGIALLKALSGGSNTLQNPPKERQCSGQYEDSPEDMTSLGIPGATPTFCVPCVRSSNQAMGRATTLKQFAGGDS